MSGGTGFLTTPGILLLALGFYFDAAIVISSTIALVVSGSIEEVFAHKDEFPLTIFVFLGDAIESIIDSSLSCEESGRVLILGFSV